MKGAKIIDFEDTFFKADDVETSCYSANGSVGIGCQESINEVYFF